MRNISEIKQREAVRLIIKAAFPNITPNLSHDECVKFRSRLALFGDDDLFDVLPKVLEDLLDTHTNNPNDSQDIEAIVRHLNIKCAGTDLNFVKKYWGKGVLDRTLANEDYLRKEKSETYSKITSHQAFAILSWLEFARNWADLEWYIDEVDCAIYYWKSVSETLCK